MDKRLFPRKNMTSVLVAGLLILGASLAYAVTVKQKVKDVPTVTNSDNRGAITDAAFSKVTLNVRDMSCSGCISTIKGALAGFQGIEDVLVDVSGGKVEVYYDSGKLKQVTEIETAITASGYPAKIIKTVSPEELRKERALAASKSQSSIASVSGYDISRADFAMELSAAKQEFKQDYGDQLFTTPQGQVLENRLRAQVAQRLIDEAILLQTISRSGYKLDEGETRSELDKYLQKNGKSEKELKESLVASGYDYDYFMKKFEKGLLINRYIDEKVLDGTSSPYERQRLLASWFNNSKSLSEIVYYDKYLEQAR